MTTQLTPSFLGTPVPVIGPKVGNPRRRKACIVAADLVVVILSMTVAHQLTWTVRHWDVGHKYGSWEVLGALSLPFWLAMFGRHHLYSSRHVVSRLDEFRHIVQATSTSVVAIAVAAYAMRRDVSRGWLVLTFVVAVMLMTVEREIVRRIFWALRAQGWQRPIIIAGANSEAVALAVHLGEHPRIGFSVVGFVDDTATVGTELVPGASVLGPVASTLEVVRSAEATGVLVATSGVSTENTNRLARQLVYEGIYVQLTSSLCDIAAERLVVHPLGRRPVISVEPACFGGWRAVAKRAFDLVLTLVAMVVLSPVLLVIAMAIKIDSRGPVFFRQTRVGRGGRMFRVWKFRTMFVDAEQRRAELWNANEADGPLFKVRNDPRVSRVGRWLRRHSLDELPQLLNVLRNEMSLVGPRPALPDELEAWSVELHNRLRVKPGLTGMWQVSGRSDCSFAEYVRLDLYYVDNWTLITDLAIVAKTVPAVLLRRGAY